MIMISSTRVHYFQALNLPLFAREMYLTIQLKKWYSTFKDHITLKDYEINDGMSLEMY